MRISLAEIMNRRGEAVKLSVPLPDGRHPRVGRRAVTPAFAGIQAGSAHSADSLAVLPAEYLRRKIDQQLLENKPVNIQVKTGNVIKLV